MTRRRTEFAAPSCEHFLDAGQFSFGTPGRLPPVEAGAVDELEYPLDDPVAVFRPEK
jgi:hypothetical protein